MIKIQYVSDLHLEHHKNNKVFKKIEKLADCENICVLGDIGYPETNIYREFMTYCSDNWENVFWVLGNHCYYHKPKTEIKTMSEIENYVKQILPKNVYFMNNDYIYLNKQTNQVSKYIDQEFNTDNYIKIIGSTLWSNIDNDTANYLNDYNEIYSHKISNDFGFNIFKLLKPEITKNMFQSSKKFILNEINDNVNSLIITHHGIHPLCQGYYLGSPLESGYVTEIPEIFQSKNVIAAICGHTHSSINLEVNGIKLLSNCYGYKGEKQDIVKFNPKAVLEIK